MTGLETHARDVPSHQLFQEAVMCCVAATCAGIDRHLVVKAYRQVILLAVSASTCFSLQPVFP